jgi:hypothetical protein
VGTLVHHSELAIASDQHRSRLGEDDLNPKSTFSFSPHDAVHVVAILSLVDMFRVKLSRGASSLGKGKRVLYCMNVVETLDSK